MWTYPEAFDVLVVGGGHAGCEAAAAAARRGCSVCLLSMSLDTVAKMSCNPAIGGTAKGQLVREIDALGGLMGQVADATGIQFRMLNRSKGPSVWAPRAQSDRFRYQQLMKHKLEQLAGIQLKQGSVEELCCEDGVICGVRTKEGIVYRARSVILSAGTFMRGLLHIGEQKAAGGRIGCAPAQGLSAALVDLGFRLIRLKTGTPARVHRRSVNLALCEEQPGEDDVSFSYLQGVPRLPQVSCYITYTTELTRDIVMSNLSRSPMYSGMIQGIGPRYCPSIEDKFFRFQDKPRHQLFLEPEGLETDELYINGMSSSLPFDVQHAMIRSIPALEKAEIMRPAYAVEYDALGPGQFDSTFQTKLIKGLFVAGQICGTSGYEEAAGQGLLAGLNAALYVQGEAPFVLGREEAYLGVMADDLATKEITEPYRMFTSRAEYRLLLRQDNADLRLTEKAYAMQLVDEGRYCAVTEKKLAMQQVHAALARLRVCYEGKHSTAEQLLRRPEMSFDQLQQLFATELGHVCRDVGTQLEIDIKYGGYVQRQRDDAKKLRELELVPLGAELNYNECEGLSGEAVEKLQLIRPRTLGQAGRIAGVTPADILVLRVWLARGAATRSLSRL